VRSESEWETDTEPPTDTEDKEEEVETDRKPAEQNKENLTLKENGEADKKDSNESVDTDSKVRCFSFCSWLTVKRILFNEQPVLYRYLQGTGTGKFDNDAVCFCYRGSKENLTVLFKLILVIRSFLLIKNGDGDFMNRKDVVAS
jgi:hypothetical protein